MVEKERGLSRFRVEENLEGGNSQALETQNPKPVEIFARRNSPVKDKLTNVKNTFEIESEEEIRALLRAMYREYRSLGATAKAFRESGINVCPTTVNSWMSHFGLDLNILLGEDDKNLVRNALQSGDFDILTEKQKNILESRGYFKEGRLTTFRKLKEVQSKTITYQAACDSERRALRRLKKLDHARLQIAQPVVRKPVGRPEKEMPSDLIVDLYSSQGLNTPTIAGMFECSTGTIIDRLRTRGVEIRPRGGYYKQK